MRIEFTRTGGFAGMRLTKSFDTSVLSADEAKHLTALVESARFFELPALMQSRGADQFQYKVAVEKDGQTHTVEVDDRAMPSSLAPLVKQLVAAARQR